MLKNKRLVILLSILIFFGFLLIVSIITNGSFRLMSNNTAFAVFKNGNEYISLEIADEPHEQALGLMNRNSINEGSSLPNSDGMLFIFEDESPRTFWMKNTYISLDILFLDKNKKVLNIEKNTKTNQIEEVYSSKGNAMYVIELVAGKSDELGISNGDIIDFAITELKYEKLDTDV